MTSIESLIGSIQEYCEAEDWDSGSSIYSNEVGSAESSRSHPLSYLYTGEEEEDICD